MNNTIITQEGEGNTLHMVSVPSLNIVVGKAKTPTGEVVGVAVNCLVFPEHFKDIPDPKLREMVTNAWNTIEPDDCRGNLLGPTINPNA